MPSDFFAAEPLKRSATQSRRRKLLRLNSFFRGRSSFLIHGSPQVRLWRYTLLSETAETDLRYGNYAHAEAGRFRTG